MSRCLSPASRSPQREYDVNTAAVAIAAEHRIPNGTIRGMGTSSSYHWTEAKKMRNADSHNPLINHLLLLYPPCLIIIPHFQRQIKRYTRCHGDSRCLSPVSLFGLVRQSTAGSLVWPPESRRTHMMTIGSIIPGLDSWTTLPGGSSQLHYSADRRSDSFGHETSSSDPPSRIMSAMSRCLSPAVFHVTSGFSRNRSDPGTEVQRRLQNSS